MDPICEDAHSLERPLVGFKGLMLLFFLPCLRLDVNNLETTYSVENTIIGRIVDMEELTE
jgi:hypothetical protein